VWHPRGVTSGASSTVDLTGRGAITSTRPAACCEPIVFGPIKAPTLAIGGGLSPESLPAGARAVADMIPDACYVTLEGEDHGVLNQAAALPPRSSTSSSDQRRADRAMAS
jgi:hypothetical protein